MHAVNSYTSTLINKYFNNTTKVKIWKGDAWDVVIRSEEKYWEKCAYTLFNPWREGMVKKPFDPFPFSNSDKWIKREGKEFMLDLFYRFEEKLRSNYKDLY